MRRISNGQAGSPMQAPCAVVTLDDQLDHARPLRLIHLDVEGYEGEALAGARNLIERWRPDLILEWQPHDSATWDDLRAFGYTVHGRVHHNTVYTAG
jgi:hypothetical protein